MPHSTTIAATQSGVTIAAPNKPFTVVDDIPRPEPGPKQALVKSLAVGLNPVECLQQQTGLLVNDWPAVLGSDCVGVVLEVGPDCVKLQPGDYVYGCAPLGQNQYTPFQDAFLVDEDVFIKKSDNVSLEEATTVGSGLLTAALCLLAGAELTLPKSGTRAAEKDEWIVVLGGTGTVGQFAVQIAHLCGYRVLASCSPAKQAIALKNGATVTFNSRARVEEQVAEIQRITAGNFARILDATAYGYDIMVQALETSSTAPIKYLTTVDDWSTYKTPSTIEEYRAELGHLCRLDDPIGAQVTRDIASWIPALEAHLAAGTLKPLEHQVVDGVGWEKLVEGIQLLESGRAERKLVVRTQEE